MGGFRGNGSRVEYKAKSNEVCLDDIWSGCFDSSFGSIKFVAHAMCSDPNAFQQVIEYNGKSGDTLNFTYREFQQDRLRAPFTTNFTMDLNAGNTIVYKGAELKVESATNQQIVYRVLRNFNHAE